MNDRQAQREQAAVAAYADNVPIEQIEQRYGIPADEIERLVADEAEFGGRESIPNTVLLPLIGFGLVALFGLLAAAVSFAYNPGGTPAVLFAVAFVAYAATAVGLWRRSRVAHTAGYVLALPFAASGIGLLATVGIIWALSVRSAKDWFGVR